MMPPQRIEPNDLDTDIQFLSLIAECLEKLEAGETLDVAGITSTRPEWASPLEEFLSDHKKLVRSLSPVAGAGDHLPVAPPCLLSPNGRVMETLFLSDQDEGASDIARSPSAQARPSAIGQYFLIEEVARGGMGVVFKARQVALHRTVALKMILAGRMATADEIDRFEREATAAGKLVHPNIVRVHEAGNYAGQPYFTMDFIEGESLSERLDDGPLNPREAAELMVKIARAIAHAHRCGIVHRDLKPANILIDAYGEPHVSDFGLAKTLNACSLTPRDLTATGQVLGTPGYMSPEQASARNESVGESSDIYSLGAILYASLTGRAPFEAQTPVATLQQVVHRDPAPVRQVNAQVPRDLETICLHCLHKKSGQRYHTASDLADDLERFLAHRPIAARRSGPLGHLTRQCRRRPDVASLVASLLLLTLLAISVVSFYRGQNKDVTAELREHYTRSLIGEAQTLRSARKSGYRDDVWSRLKQALAVPGISHDWDEIRQLAILCMGDFVGSDPTLINGPARNRPNSCTLFLDDQRVLCGLEGGDVSIRILGSPDEESRISRYGAAVRAATVIDPSGDAVLLGDMNHLERWDRNSRGIWLQSWKVRATFPARFTRLSLLGNSVLVPQAQSVQTYALHDGRPGEPFVVPPSAAPYDSASVESSPRFRAVAASPDGRFVAAAVTSAEIFVWDAVSGELSDRLYSGATGTPHLQFDAESEFLISGSDQGIHIFPCEDFSRWSNFRTDPVQSLATSPTGQTLLMLTDSGTVQLWDLAMPRPTASLIHPHDPKQYEAVSFSDSGDRFLSCGTHKICVWNLRGFGEKQTMRGVLQSADLIACSPKAPLLASASTRGVVAFWNTESGQLWESPFKLGTAIRAMKFSSDGNWLAAVSSDTLFVWPLQRGNVGQYLQRPIKKGPLRDLCFLAGAPEIMVIGERATSRWKLSTPSSSEGGHHRNQNVSVEAPIVLEHVRDYPVSGTSIAIAGTKPRVTVGTGAELRCFDLAGNQLKAAGSLPLGLCGDLTTCRASSFVTAFANDGLIKTVDVDTRQVTCCQYQRSVLNRGPLAITPEGRCAAVVDNPNSLAIYDLSENKFLFRLPAEQAAIRSLSWSGDGCRLAAGLASGDIVVWDMRIIASVLRQNGLWGPLTLWDRQASEVDAKYASPVKEQHWQKTSEATVSQNRLRQLLEQWAVPEVDPQHESTSLSFLPANLQRSVRESLGAVSTKDLIALRVADRELEKLDASINRHGYQLHGLCPYWHEHALWWSVCWQRSPEPYELRTRLSEAELVQTQSAMQRLGFEIAKLGAYRSPDGDGTLMHFAVFEPAENDASTSRVILASYRNREFHQRRRELLKQYRPVTTHLAFDHLGEAYVSEIWQPHEHRSDELWETVEYPIHQATEGRERLTDAVLRFLHVARDPGATDMVCRVVLQPQSEPPMTPLIWNEPLEGAITALRRMMAVGYRPRLVTVVDSHEHSARATVVLDLPDSQLTPDGQWRGDWTDI